MERNEAAEKGCLACSFPFWDKLTEAQQEYLCRFARPVRYEKGAHVHSPTENCVGILLLRSGQLRAYLLSEDGRDVTLYRLFAGGCVHPFGQLCAGRGDLRRPHRRRGAGGSLLHRRGRIQAGDG